MDTQAATSSHFINFVNDGSSNTIVANATVFNDDEEEVDPTMLCRICSATCKTFMPIYEGEGLDNKLAEKINNYLPITVDDGDYLPDKICTVCVNTLIAWDELVRCCIKSNATLTEMLEKADNINIFKIKPVKMKTVVNGKSKSRERSFPVKRNTTKRYSEDEQINNLDIKLQESKVDAPMDYISDDSRTFISVLDRSSENSSSGTDGEFHADFFHTESSSEETEDRNKEIFCRFCHKHIIAKTYINHVTHHMNEKIQWPCEQCGKGFNFEANLSRHVKQVHEKIRYPCDTCSKTFITRRDLVEHKHREGGIRPFICHMCGKSFVTKENYKFHSRRHVLIKSKPEFVCQICQKVFRNKRRFDRHSLVHNDEKNFLCPLCKTRVKTQASLKWHMQRKHSDK